MARSQTTLSLIAALLLCCAAAAVNEPRHALVIGNAAYSKGALRNPVNDARLMEQALKACGFQVALATDCTLEQMESAVRAFGQAIRVGGAAFFFYAGHGLQVHGENYLQPVGVELSNETEVRYRCMPLGIVTGAMETAGTRHNFIVLDACRDNPFARGFARSDSARGLAQPDSTPGTIIAFSTAPGRIAEDGAGNNSAYTAALAAALQTPGRRALDVFVETSRNVQTQLGNRQNPWISLSPIDDFYFLPGGSAGTSTPPPPPPPPPVAPAMVGHLQVAVNAPNAKVYVDGRERGLAFPESALNITDLSVGEVTVKVEAEGFEATEKRVRIAGGTWAQEAFELMKKVLAPPPSPPPPPGDLKAGTERTFAGIEMVWVPPGNFMREGNQVTLSRGFWLGKHEVTQSQWEKVMGNNPSQFKGDGRLPVERVSWNDAQEFIRKLNGQGAGTFRLPTEAEWEYACRAGSTTAYYFGDNESQLGDHAWFSGNSGHKSHVVGGKLPNAWGLYDMHGNVWEWCQDWYGSYPSGAVSDPTGPGSGSSRVVRGGSWSNDPGGCRSAGRGLDTPDYAGTGYGFRLLRTP